MYPKIICYCKRVTEEQIEQAIINGANKLQDIKRITGACTSGECKKLNPKGKCCSSDIESIIERIRNR